MNTTNHLPINPSLSSAKGFWYPELYTIKEAKSVKFFKRRDAVDRTVEKAIELKQSFTILLNGVGFFKILEDGSKVCIYRPEQDFITSPTLKAYFIKQGLVYEKSTFSTKPKPQKVISRGFVAAA